MLEYRSCAPPSLELCAGLRRATVARSQSQWGATVTPTTQSSFGRTYWARYMPNIRARGSERMRRHSGASIVASNTSRSAAIPRAAGLGGLHEHTQRTDPDQRRCPGPDVAARNCCADSADGCAAARLKADGCWSRLSQGPDQEHVRSGARSGGRKRPFPRRQELRHSRKAG
jgi:hypothetical protein